jgi:hypothetical protein
MKLINQKMTFIKLFITLLGLSALVALYSCSDPAGPKKYPAPVVDLVATSIDSTSISINWVASATESNPAFDRYVVSVNGTDGYSRWDTILRVSNPYKISGLKQEVIYRIDVYTMIKGGELSEKSSIVWAPAYRFKEVLAGVPIRVYEQSSPLGCGLDLFFPETLKPRTLPLDSSQSWNLALSIDSNVMFGSPRLLGYDYKEKLPAFTEISDFYYDTPTLDIVYGSEPLNVALYSSKLVNLTEVEPQIKSHLILLVRTRETGDSINFNYDKILIKKIDGKFLQGTATNRYIECEISYQKTLNVGYAKKPVH